MPNTLTVAPQFDALADDYDSMLNQGLSVSGEDKNYFAQKRVEWLARSLRAWHAAPRHVLDFGCGTGSATPFLLDVLHADSVTGVDVSTASLDVARKTHVELSAEFCTPADLPSRGKFDLAYCSGVFHHIVPAQRRESAAVVLDALRPGGAFALWENNPWNPGTRYVMSRIPFDRDAIPLSAIEARAILTEVGFEIDCTNFLFVFPRLLSPLRFIEPALTRLPLGAQYMVLARKPDVVKQLKCTSSPIERNS